MIQFLADNIDQLDLALDQLAIGDRNFDRFALMLIDNVVELTLHRHAQDKARENELWLSIDKPKYQIKDIELAIGKNFEPKVKFAKKLGILSQESCDSILNLHNFRNTAYHQGQRHEGTLHSITIFYFINACDVLLSYSPRFWSWSSSDQLSHRARKYLGKDAPLGDHAKRFQSAFRRLRDVALSMKEDLVGDLYADMSETITHVHEAIDFLFTNRKDETTRDRIVMECQAWKFASTDEGKEFIKTKRCKAESGPAIVEWLIKNYKWPIVSDPIPSWLKRLARLKSEKNYHLALKRYCDFMRQTESIRETVIESAIELENYIQMQIDIARGK